MYDNYRKRIELRGGNIREANKLQTITIMENTFDYSQNYRKVIIDDTEIDARFISDSSTTVRGGSGTYVIEFRDKVDYPAGTYVKVPNNNGEYDVWLIIYKSDSIMFPKHIAKKCNYLLKWKNTKGNIVERWAVFSDNNKLIDGERNVNYNRLRISYYATPLIIPCDSETINITIDKRFIIDHNDVDGYPEAWIVTNRNIVSKTFADYDGVIELTLSRHQFNKQTDSKELMIADYYEPVGDIEPIDEQSPCDVKITYAGLSDLKMGIPYKKYTAEFYINGEISDSIEASWEIVIPEEFEQNFDYKVVGNTVQIKCVNDSNMVGSHIRLIASNYDHGCSAELPIKVVNAL